MISQDEACADYTSAIEFDPTDTALFNGRAFARLRAASSQDVAAAQTTLQRALNDVDRALALDDCNGPAHCTRGAILKQIALTVANGATDKAAAAVAGDESEKEWTELIDEAIAAQRAAVRLEPDAQEPRDYLKELLAMLGIEEEVADVQDRSDWANSVSSIPAPQCDKTGQPRSKEGWLHKKGGLKDGERNWVKGGKRNWKARWVALDGKSIRWYDVKGGKELGNIQMTVFDRVELDAEK
jgi:tetratricopeptide (TPR) repeat protein|eukprot:COSAG02_NODE_441_length_22281_cov_6.119556_27_plen_241_part_00